MRGRSHWDRLTNLTAWVCRRPGRLLQTAEGSQLREDLHSSAHPTDGKFRAFDSRAGKELWTDGLGVDVNSIPITWQGKNGKQYIAALVSGGAHHGAKPGPIYAYTLQ